MRIGAGRGADLRALDDALDDRGEPEEAERDVEADVVDVTDPGVFAVARHQIGFAREAEHITIRATVDTWCTDGGFEDKSLLWRSFPWSHSIEHEGNARQS